jgi:hypothetical protein
MLNKIARSQKPEARSRKLERFEGEAGIFDADFIKPS